MADRLLDEGNVGLLAEGDTLRVTGQPGFDNAMILCDAGIRWFESHHPTRIDIDVSDIVSSNGGVLCVLLEWLRYTDRHDIKVSRIALSTHLRELVDIAGLNAIPAFGTSVDTPSQASA